MAETGEQDLAISEREKKRRETISKGLRRLYAKEKFRIISGLEPKTKLVSVLPKRMRKHMSSLCFRRGYFHIGKLHDGTLYYDSNTKRSAAVEKFAMQKYGIKILPAKGNPP